MAIGEGPKSVSRFEWWYHDLEQFVKNNWDAKWEGGAAMGFPAQNTYVDVTIDFGDDNNGLWMENYTLEEAKTTIEKFKAEGMPREEHAEPSVELLLNWLCHEGLIPDGDYRILVHW